MPHRLRWGRHGRRRRRRRRHHLRCAAGKRLQRAPSFIASRLSFVVVVRLLFVFSSMLFGYNGWRD